MIKNHTKVKSLSNQKNEEASKEAFIKQVEKGRGDEMQMLRKAISKNKVC